MKKMMMAIKFSIEYWPERCNEWPNVSCYQMWRLEVMVMVLKDTFNNISVIYRSEETGVSRENNRHAARYWQSLSHNVVSNIPSHLWDSNSQR